MPPSFAIESEASRADRRQDPAPVNIKAVYEHLRAAGKPPKLAIAAAVRKLLHAVYSVAKNRKPFVHTTQQARPA